jgi:methionine biosynthesis protein MetW
MSAPVRSKTDKRYRMPDPRLELTDEVVITRVPPRSRVLDLGCGDGRLLASLRDGHHCSVQGIDVDRESMVLALARGIPVIHCDLDRGLAGFPDDSFDVAILSQTLQQVRHPRMIVKEMLRVAKRTLVVVPNYGQWRVRWHLLIQGRAPVTENLPYEWYDTPNLHFMSMLDFRELAGVVGARIVEELPLRHGRPLTRNFWSNWRADSALYMLEHK